MRILTAAEQTKMEVLIVSSVFNYNGSAPVVGSGVLKSLSVHGGIRKSPYCMV
jgi:hypothetical protein